MRRIKKLCINAASYAGRDGRNTVISSMTGSIFTIFSYAYEKSFDMYDMLS